MTKKTSDEKLRHDLSCLLRVIRATANPDNLPDTTIGRRAVFDSVITYAGTAKELLEVREGVTQGMRTKAARRAIINNAKRAAAEAALLQRKISEDTDEDVQLLPGKKIVPTAKQAQKAPEPIEPTTVGPAKETKPDPVKNLFKVPVKSSTREYTATEKLEIRDEILRGFKHKGMQARLIRHYNLTQGAVYRMKRDKKWLKNMRKAAGYDEGNGLPAPKASPYHYTPDEKIVLAKAYRALPHGRGKQAAGKRLAMEKHYHASPASFDRWHRAEKNLRVLSAVLKGDPDHPDIPAELMNIEPRARALDYATNEKAAIGKEYRFVDNMHTMGMHVAISSYYNISCNTAKYWKDHYPPVEPTQEDLDEALDFGKPRLGLGLPRPRRRPLCRLCDKPGHNATNCKVMPERMALVHEYMHLKNRNAPGIRNEWLVRHTVSLEILQAWANRYHMGYTVS
jgi:hypothetical protein|tara:strand:- start:6493 stop:7851 length:1359 start_codon:yes stop_codon:yes gene_type:complete